MMSTFELVCCIVNDGHGSKALGIAKRSGASGGTIFYGNGTVRSKLLEILDLNEIRREIVLMITQKDKAHGVIETLSREMSFHKRNHGIAFSCSVSHFIGTKHLDYEDSSEKRTEGNTVYNAIFAIVDRGQAEDAVEAATAAGARGGTIIHARGAGIHENDVVFAMPIEPEKEIALILSESDTTKAIVSSVTERLHIDKPGNGVIFVLDVNEACGLYKG